MTVQLPLLTDGGITLTCPYFVGDSQTTASAIALDTFGTALGSVTFEHDGASRIELWRSANSPASTDPVNDAAIKWLYVGVALLADGGMSPLDPKMQQELSRGRWVKFDRTHGVNVTIHCYAAAAA